MRCVSSLAYDFHLDLADGGARHFAETISKIKQKFASAFRFPTIYAHIT